MNAFRTVVSGKSRWALLPMLLWLPLLAGTQVAAQQSAKDQPAPPENVVLQTTDGKNLAATYYASRLGKEAAAVILLHAHGGNRAEFDHLALALQTAGSAVIVPDLRGHGESQLGIKDLRADDYTNMVRRDLEAVKGFLLRKNNAGELNIDRLGVVGVELGASLAINWAALDWDWPVLATGKQGQDVKALALISPEWGFKGIRISDAVVDPSVRSQISFLVVCGARNSRMQAESKRLYNALARYQDVSDSLPIEKQTLFLRTPATSLQGMPLLNEKSMNVEQMIVEFVDLRLLKPAYSWQERKSPL